MSEWRDDDGEPEVTFDGRDAVSELLIGHMVNRSGGRERVYVIIRCAHPDPQSPEAPKEFITERYEYDRLDMDQRPSLINRCVLEHRSNVFEQSGIRCSCPVPKEFSVHGAYAAEGET